MKEKIYRFMTNRPVTLPIATGIIGLGSGIGLGYFLANRKHKAGDVYEVPKQDFRLVESVVAVIPEYDGEALEAPEALKEIGNVIETTTEEVDKIGSEFVKQVLDLHKEDPQLEPVIQSIFAEEDDDDWDYDEEVANRTTDEPYVLHKDEFYAEEMHDQGYSQETLTYYAGDDIMTDQDDHPVYNYSSVVGLMKFGHGSGDPNVVYVRNDKLKSEYEVVYDQGMYSREVLGLEIENNARATDLKHSGHHRKFKLDE